MSRLLLASLGFFALSCRTFDHRADSELAGSGQLLPREDRRYVALGVSPDCREAPYDFERLVALAESPTVTNQQDFLDQLPKGIMQTFTLLYESGSAQMDGIDAEFPGVIRMSQNGKLIFRYTCNRSVRYVYNKVEVLRFDDASSRFRLAELNFNKEAGQRLQQDPPKCYGCHNQTEQTDDPRPNWEMYPEWPGVFASHDDFFPDGSKADYEHVHHAPGWKPAPTKDEVAFFAEEKANFERFVKNKVKGDPMNGIEPDPCYTALPWPDWRKPELTPDFVNYPFDIKNGHARDRIYALRPNLKFTEILSHLMGRRNYRKLAEHPDYRRAKYWLAVEAGRCVDKDLKAGRVSYVALHNYLREVTPGYATPDATQARSVPLRGFDQTHHDPRHADSKAQGLFGVGQAFGFAPSDWTMTFGYPERSEYETGAGPGANRDFPADLPLTAYVQHFVLEDVAKELGVAERFTHSTGESDDFGKHFQCIDEIAGATVFSSEAARRDVCERLITKALAEREAVLAQARTRSPVVSRGTLPPGVPPPFPKPFRKDKDDLRAYVRKLNDQTR